MNNPIDAQPAAQQPPVTQPNVEPSAPVSVPSPVPIAATEPVALPPTTPPAATNKGFDIRNNKLLMGIAGVIALGILIFGFLYVRSAAPANVEAPVAITPTQIPTPTPQPNLSRISTTSAFLSYVDEVASFSGIINSFSLQDATLVPPILDIELELKN